MLYPFARPFLRLDGEELPLVWKRAEDFSVGPGEHCVETFIRYAGFPWGMGTGRLRVVVQEGEMVELLARNGPLNHQPLQPQRLDRTPIGSAA